MHAVHSDNGPFGIAPLLSLLGTMPLGSIFGAAEPALQGSWRLMLRHATGVKGEGLARLM
jgi:hypothetical protein